MGQVGGVKDEKEEKDKKEEKEEKEKIKEEEEYRKRQGRREKTREKRKQLRKQKRERPRVEKKDESYLGISSTEIHRARRLSQAFSPLFFFSLWTFYFAVNTDLVMDLCLEILRFIILAMS